MGLLDDAIRDHLELKRRHGADPSEVAQQEQEALGPARLDPPEPVEDEAMAAEEEDEEEYEPLPADRLQETTDEEEPVYDEDLFGEDDEELRDAGPDDDPARQAGAVRADDVFSGDEDSEDDDVLEETPEFLQETPEHDRLWFEQKPPKDFDLD